MTRRQGTRSLMLAAVLAGAVAVRDARAAIVADSANDICGPAVDPCYITQTVTVVSGSILDFGTRTVQVSGNGVIDVGGGTARIRVGRLVVFVSGTGIKLNDGALEGLLTLESCRKCSLSVAVRCLIDATCAAAGAGASTAGNGDVDLQGKTLGSAEYAAAFVVRAAGEVRIG